MCRYLQPREKEVCDQHVCVVDMSSTQPSTMRASLADGSAVGGREPPVGDEACRSGRQGPSESPAPSAAVDERHAVAGIMRPQDGLRVRQFCRCYGYVKCVEDTTSDNASSTQPKALVGYIDDTQFRAGDKCRSGAGNYRERAVGPRCTPLLISKPSNSDPKPRTRPVRFNVQSPEAHRRFRHHKGPGRRNRTRPRTPHGACSWRDSWHSMASGRAIFSACGQTSLCTKRRRLQDWRSLRLPILRGDPD